MKDAQGWIDGVFRWLPALAVGVGVAATLAVALALFPFAVPWGDDFCNGVDARRYGVLEAVWVEYVSWGGRWAAHALVVGFPSIFHLTEDYAVGPAAIFAAFALALRFLIGSLLPRELRRGTATALTLVLLALFWAGMPHPGESVYLLEGAFVYSLNLALGCVLVGALLRLPSTPSRGRALAAGALALLGFLVSAFHELVALLLIGILGVGALAALAWGDRRGYPWAVAAAGCVAGLVTVVLAPGNATRQEFVGEGGSVVRAAVATVEMWVRVLDVPVRRGPELGHNRPLGWLLDARLFAASLLFWSAPAIRSARGHWPEHVAQLLRWLAPAMLFALLTGCFLAGGWALGRTLPLRAFNALYLVLLLGWFLTLFAYLPREAARERPGVSPPLRVAAACVLALGLVLSTNVKQGLHDFVEGWPQAFHRAMERRYDDALAAAARGERRATLAPIDGKPASYFHTPLPEVSDELRHCFAGYFRLEDVRVAPTRGAKSERGEAGALRAAE